MKKQGVISMLVAAGITVTAFAGCSNNGSGSSSASTTSFDSSKSVTLTWALWDKDKTTYYQPLIDGFKAKYPNVTINMKDLGSTDYQTALGTQLAGGDSGLDIVCVKDVPGYAAMTNAGQLEDLSSYIKANNIDTSQYGGLTDQLKVNGKLYELPFRSDFWIMYYNKDIFDKAGVAYPTNDMTLTQYDALARKVTSGSGNNKIYGSYFHTWRSTVELFGTLDGKHTVLDGDYSWMKPYYDLVLKEQDDGVTMPYATIKTSNTSYNSQFESNKIATLTMGSWFLSTLIADNKSGKSIAKNFGIVKYPHPDGVKAGTTIGTITALAVPTSTKNKAAALEFLKYVTGPDGAAIIAKTGTIPAIKSTEVVSAISGMDGFPSDQNSKDALQTAKMYLEMPMNSKASQIDTALQNDHDAIMTKSVTVDAGLKQMATDVKPLLSGTTSSK